MGWKRRDWLFGIAQHHVFDSRGNIGPTVWWDGEIIGSWAVTSAGEIRTSIAADRGAAARDAIADAAARLHTRLEGSRHHPRDPHAPGTLTRARHHRTWRRVRLGTLGSATTGLIACSHQ